MDGADRAEPRPGEPKQDVEAWRANPPLPKSAAFRTESRFCFHSGNRGIFHAIFIDPNTGKTFSRTTRTNDERTANAIAQKWLVEGFPDEPQPSTALRKIVFCDYLKQVWDFDASDYFAVQGYKTRLKTGGQGNEGAYTLS
jgi:hypothetical protein